MNNYSNTKRKLFPLKGQIQNYDWGGSDYISQLLDMNFPQQKCAEYWLGAHAKAPSTVCTSKGEIALDSFWRDKRASVNHKGKSKANQFPFLFKVLDVNSMLSIQVHPSKEAAEHGFAQENKRGIPITASHRNFKDDNHKPEIMVALSEFWLLHGFLSKELLMSRLRETPELKYLLPVFLNDGYFGLYKTVMEQSQEETNTRLQPLINKVILKYNLGKLEKNSPDYWAAKAATTLKQDNHIDKGIYSIYFFNILKINEGEAIFQDAGVPHAYLEGQNIELMSNSDNVLRGGLTRKHIDVPELLNHIIFEETVPKIIKGSLQEDQLESIYHTPVKDFELSKIEIQSDTPYVSRAKSIEILMVLEGDLEIIEKTTLLALKFKKGASIFLDSGSRYEISTKSLAVFYKAKVPQD